MLSVSVSVCVFQQSSESMACLIMTSQRSSGTLRLKITSCVHFSVSAIKKELTLTSVKAASVHTEQINHPLSAAALTLLVCVFVLYNVSCSAFK